MLAEHADQPHDTERGEGQENPAAQPHVPRAAPQLDTAIVGKVKLSHANTFGVSPAGPCRARRCS